MRLGALLYLVERESLVRFAAPVFCDTYVAMAAGIVVRSVFDWNELPAPDMTPDDKLSPAELNLIEAVFSTHENWTTTTLLDFTQRLPEWRDPAGSVLLIPPDEILRVAGYSAADREQIRGEWEEAAYARSIFA